MIKLRHVFPALCLATSFTALTATAVAAQAAPDGASAAPDAATPSTGGGHGPKWGHRGHWDLAGMGFVLHKLDLTAQQKSMIKSKFATTYKNDLVQLRQNVEANRMALASTPPGTAAYETLITTAQSNATARITLASKIWTDIYTSVLNSTQQAEIPGIVAAAQAARQSKIDEWKAEHPQSP